MKCVELPHKTAEYTFFRNANDAFPKICAEPYKKISTNLKGLKSDGVHFITLTLAITNQKKNYLYGLWF